MARTMFDNMRAAVANTRSNDIKMIDIDELHDSPDNFFEINRIEELADEILMQGGVKENLIVRALPVGGYEIISGHRRKSAVRYLLDSGNNVSRVLPCLVETYGDEDKKNLDLILMNVSQRQLSDQEMYKSYEKVNEILLRRKESGEKFGKLREKIAEYLNVSAAQVGKFQNIDKHAIEEVKEALEEGRISASTANDIAKLNPDEQKKVISDNPEGLKPKKLKEHKKTKQVDEKDSLSESESQAKVDININFSSEEESLIKFVKENKENLTGNLILLAEMVDTASEKELLNRLAEKIDEI